MKINYIKPKITYYNQYENKFSIEQTVPPLPTDNTSKAAYMWPHIGKTYDPNDYPSTCWTTCKLIL